MKYSGVLGEQVSAKSRTRNRINELVVSLTVDLSLILCARSYFSFLRHLSHGETLNIFLGNIDIFSTYLFFSKDMEKPRL